MLSSLQKIGALVLEERGAYDALVWPKDQFKHKKNKDPTYVEIVLDPPLYAQQLTAGAEPATAAAAAVRTGEVLTQVSLEWLWRHGGVRMTGGPATPSHYPGVRAKNLLNLVKGLFGKPDGKGGFGGSEMIKWFGGELSEGLVEVIETIQPLAQAVVNHLGGEGWKTTAFKEAAGLPDSGDPVFVYVSVVSHTGSNAIPLAQVADNAFQEAYKAKVAPSEAVGGHPADATKVSYLGGARSADAGLPDFDGRYNLNKIFVTTTVNYAGDFTKGNFERNYSLAPSAAQELNAASEYLLNKQKVVIGGITHVVVPTVVGESFDDLDELKSLQEVTDLAFGYKSTDSIKAAAGQAASMSDAPYWLDFIAFDSNGNFFKVVNWIHEVPRFHLDGVVDALRKASDAHQRFLAKNRYFNLYQVYKAIPVIGDNAGPRNDGLTILKALLERRPISEQRLFAHFRELVLCHRYGRYRKFPNVYEPKGGSAEETMSNGLGNAVTDYAVIRLALHQLQILTEHTMADNTASAVFEDIAPDLQRHFDLNAYSDRAKGVFFLGRALSTMAYEQARRGNSKRIMQKVNFNGMGYRRLCQLHNDLAESGLSYKAKEPRYDTVFDKLTYDLGRCNKVLGSEEEWLREDSPFGKTLNPEAALYYLLAGANWRPKPKPKPSDDSTGDNSPKDQ